MAIYQFKLSEQFRALAKDELGEDDGVRKRLIPLLRALIEKNFFIYKCRTDDRFLLKFLRFRKFNVDDAGRAIERYLVARQKLSDWFKYSDPCDPAIAEILNNSPIVVLGRDELCRTVLLIRLRRFSVEKITHQLLMGMIMMFLEVLVDEEEVQIGGLRVWLDFNDMAAEFIPMLNLAEMSSTVDVITKTMPVRIHEIHAVSLPKCATYLARFVLSFASLKLREQIRCHKTQQEAKEHMPEALWPEEYGGSLDSEELTQQLRLKMAKRRESLVKMDDKLEIDVSQYAGMFVENAVDIVDVNEEIDSGITGIYRELTID